MRMTIRENAGRHRAYSFDVDATYSHVVPGTYSDRTGFPDWVQSEMESLAQSDECPAFLWNPDGFIYIDISD